jgi:hypothetical protein
MKKIMKYSVRTILAILGMTAVCVVLGEPNEALSRWEVVAMKSVALAVMLGAIKGWMLTLTERERRELEDERV